MCRPPSTSALEAIVERSEAGLSIDVVSDQADFIIESRDGLLREGGLGAIFAVLTIFAFLFSLRSTFVAALSIPLSLLIALVLMQLTGITINIMTLGGMAVAVGRVVDDSIVVLENIYRHRAMGEDRLTAALRGPQEVAGAITSSTLTTVAVFLPLGFAGGLVSQFFLPFALTVTFALLASLVVALTVIPVLGYFLVGRPGGDVDASGEPRRSFWVRIYDPTIRFVLRSRWTSLAVVVGALVLFVASLFIAPLLPTQFLNAGSEKFLSVSLSPPAGTTSRGGPGARRRGRCAPARGSRRRARPDDRAAGGRHRIPDAHRRPAGSRRELGDAVHPARSRDGPRRRRPASRGGPRRARDRWLGRDRPADERPRHEQQPVARGERGR